MATYVKIRIRRDNIANWTAANPLLALGEIGADMSSLRLKVGNGTDTWNNLPYINGNYNDTIGELIRKLTKDDSGIGHDFYYFDGKDNIDPSIKKDGDIRFEAGAKTFQKWDGTTWKDINLENIGGIDDNKVKEIIAAYDYSSILNPHLNNINNQINSVNSTLQTQITKNKTDINNVPDQIQGKIKDAFDKLLYETTYTDADNKNKWEKLRNIIELIFDEKMEKLLEAARTEAGFEDEDDINNKKSTTPNMNRNSELLASLGGTGITLDNDTITRIWEGKNFDGSDYEDTSDTPLTVNIKNKIEEQFGLLGDEYTVTYNSDGYPSEVTYKNNGYKLFMTYDNTIKSQLNSVELKSSNDDGATYTHEKTMEYTYDANANLIEKHLAS